MGFLLTSLVCAIKKRGAVLILHRGQRVHDYRVRDKAIGYQGDGYVVSPFVVRRSLVEVVLSGFGI